MKLSAMENFRRSMGWFHTWLGIALGAVLFAVFWTGTLTVFDKEIDQWMKPELRLPAQEPVSLNEVVLPHLQALDLQPGSAVWVGPPRERLPAIRLFYNDAAGKPHNELLDPRTGEAFNLTDSHAASEFLFHFHFMLHMPGIWGYYIVALAALGMMALIISGIFIHRKFIQEFFTFRPQKKPRRSVLDFHNLTAVIALPFHFILPFSGVLILITAYFPWSMGLPFNGDTEALNKKQLAYESPMVEPSGEPAELIKELDGYIAQANDIWRAAEGDKASEPDWIALFNVKDATSYVVVERYFANRRVALGPDQIVFDPRSGAVVDQYQPKPVHSANNWIDGLHWIQFDHWLLRWLYFFAGLSGCAMIGSGLIFWMEARRKTAQTDSTSIRVVRTMSVGAITGIILATLGFFIANRLIPKEISIEGVHRHDLEIWLFFAVWALAVMHAALRDRFAWREQSFAIAVFSLATIALNWVTTGDHLIAAMSKDLWPVALMDIALLVAAVSALWVTKRLKRDVSRASENKSAVASPELAK